MPESSVAQRGVRLVGAVILAGVVAVAAYFILARSRGPQAPSREAFAQRPTAPQTPLDTGEAGADRAAAPVAPGAPGQENSEDPPPERWELALAGDGKFAVECRGVPIVQAQYLFWGPGWTWAGIPLDAKHMTRTSKRVTGTCKVLGMDLEALAREEDGEIAFAYTMEVEADVPGAIGGGIEFRFQLDSPLLRGSAAKPILRRDGWSWRVPGGEVALRCSPPPADVYFERGDPSRVRLFFFKDQVPAGDHAFNVTLSLPGDGGFARMPAERYGPKDTVRWQASGNDLTGSPVDLRSLNHRPAGAKGRVRPQGSELVFGGGEPARFWGTNIAAHTLFDNKPLIRQHARRIAALGHNLVRIHHHDSMGWVRPCVIQVDRNDTQHIDAEQLDKIHYWVKCLKDEGVYVWIDLHVGRLLKPGDAEGPHGRIMGMDPLLDDKGDLKGYCYYDEAIAGLMERFNADYLGRVNPYTGFALKDEPAVAGVLITNENDLTHHYGNHFLPDHGRKPYVRAFEKAVKRFAAEKGLDRGATWRTWEPGPSKIFLNEMEHRFNEAQIAFLRDLGLEAPLATTNYWGDNRLFCLPALADGGVIDVHSYGEPEALGRNPLFEPNFIANIACAQVEGMPLTISEWNVPYPAADRFTAPLYVASIAALQGWDAPMLYTYAYVGLANPQHQTVWSSFTDPGLTAVLPAAALLYRRGDAALAREHYCFAPSADTLYGRGLRPATSAALRTICEQSRLSIALPEQPHLDWEKAQQPPAGSRVFDDPDQVFLPSGAEFVESDTRELRRYWDKGLQTINTPRSQGVQGWLRGNRIELQDARFQIQTPKAVVILTSLADDPIASSERILLTVVARVEPGPNGQALPLRSEPVEGDVWLKGRSGLALAPLSSSGKEGEPRPLPNQEGDAHIVLPQPRGIHWYLIVPAGDAKKPAASETAEPQPTAT